MPVFYLIFPFFYNDRLSYVGSTCSIMHLFKSALILYRNTYYRGIHKTVQSLWYLWTIFNVVSPVLCFDLFMIDKNLKVNIFDFHQIICPTVGVFQTFTTDFEYSCILFSLSHKLSKVHNLIVSSNIIVENVSLLVLSQSYTEL